MNMPYLAYILLLPMVFFSFSVNAEMQPLPDEEMLTVTGEGIAFVIEDFQVVVDSSDLDFTLTGFDQYDGTDVSVIIDQLYWTGEGSEYGTIINDDTTFNLGRLTNPFTFQLLDGNSFSTREGNGWIDKTVLSLAAPIKYEQGLDSGGSPLMVEKLLSTGEVVTNPDGSSKMIAANPLGYNCTNSAAVIGSGLCASRPGLEKFDLGVRLGLDFLNDSIDQNVNINFQSGSFDGSYIRFWGGQDASLGNAFMMELQANVYAERLKITNCNFSSGACGESITLREFEYDLVLGDAEWHQPATFEVDADGNFIFEVKMMPQPGDATVPDCGSSRAGGCAGSYTTGEIARDGKKSGSDPVTWEYFKDYYENGRKGNFTTDSMHIGSSDLGASRMTGIQIHYLRVKSHEI